MCVKGARYSENILWLDFLTSFHINLLWKHCEKQSTNAARLPLCLNLKSELEHPTSCTAARRAREGARTKVGMQGGATAPAGAEKSFLLLRKKFATSAHPIPWSLSATLERTALFRALHCGCTVCLHFHPRFQRPRHSEGREKVICRIRQRRATVNVNVSPSLP